MTSPEEQLIKTGMLVNLDIINTNVEPCPGSTGEVVTQAELWLGEKDEDEIDGRTNDVEWGAFGFIYLVAMLSFIDAKPRGISGIDYEANDFFHLWDLMECLSYERGRLYFYADYVRGRCLKTRITVNPDGRVSIQTVNRGNALLRWLDRIKGKKPLSLVGTQNSNVDT